MIFVTAPPIQLPLLAPERFDIIGADQPDACPVSAHGHLPH